MSVLIPTPCPLRAITIKPSALFSASAGGSFLCGGVSYNREEGAERTNERTNEISAGNSCLCCLVYRNLPHQLPTAVALHYLHSMSAIFGRYNGLLSKILHVFSSSIYVNPEEGDKARVRVWSKLHSTGRHFTEPLDITRTSPSPNRDSSDR